MALNKNDLLALIANLFPDNTEQFITPAKLRQGLEQMVSSDLNLQELTTQEVLGLILYSNLAIKTGLANPAYQEGLVFYDDSEKALSYYNEESDTKINTGQEIVIKVINGGATTIANGDAVRFDSAIGGIPTVVKSLAVSTTEAVASGLATHDIGIGQTGYITRTGKVSGVDTSMWAVGDTLYVSDITAGALVNLPPAVVSSIAIVLTSELDGKIFTATSRLQTPVALGQSRNGPVPVTQLVTTTPTPIEAYNNTPFSINTTVNTPAQGAGFRAQFSPATESFSGVYTLSGQAAITGTANNIIFFEVYRNGIASGLISVVDLSNNTITFGSTSISAFTENPVISTDVIEAYIYCDIGTSSVTFSSMAFNIERLGVE